MNVTKVYTTPQGHSDFEVIDELRVEAVPFGKDTILLSQPIKCETLMAYEFDESSFLDWHNPPQSGYMVMLEGELEITVKNGKSKKFVAGDIFTTVDTTGSGHITKALKKGKALIIKL